MSSLLKVLETSTPTSAHSVELLEIRELLESGADPQIEIVGATEARSEFRQLRKRAQDGYVAVIAPRGKVGTLATTTIMISAERLIGLLADVQAKLEQRPERRRADAILAQLETDPAEFGELGLRRFATEETQGGLGHAPY